MQESTNSKKIKSTSQKVVKSKLTVTLSQVQEKIKANASKLDLIIQHLSQTSNVRDTLAAATFPNVQVVGSNQANVQLLAS